MINVAHDKDWSGWKIVIIPYYGSALRSVCDLKIELGLLGKYFPKIL